MPGAEDTIVDCETRRLIEGHDAQCRHEPVPAEDEERACYHRQHVASGRGGKGGHEQQYRRDQHFGHARRQGIRSAYSCSGVGQSLPAEVVMMAGMDAMCE